MQIKYLTIYIFFIALLTSCTNKSTKALSAEQIIDGQNDIKKTTETIDNNFDNFIEKFTKDSMFQLSRTNFPLKTQFYDIDKDKDSIVYKDKSDFEMLDFSKKKSVGQFDQWEQNRMINNINATIEIRGIDNGIMIDFFFKKIEGIWMLIAIDDKST